MKNQNSPEVITVNDQNFGSHGEHWNLLTSRPETDVPKWLGLALDAPVMPMGLCQSEDEMDQSFWLIQGPQGQNVTINQENCRIFSFHFFRIYVWGELSCCPVFLLFFIFHKIPHI